MISLNYVYSCFFLMCVSCYIDVGGGHHTGKAACWTVREWDVWLWAAQCPTGASKFTVCVNLVKNASLNVYQQSEEGEWKINRVSVFVSEKAGAVLREHSQGDQAKTGLLCCGLLWSGFPFFPQGELHVQMSANLYMSVKRNLWCTISKLDIFSKCYEWIWGYEWIWSPTKSKCTIWSCWLLGITHEWRCEI